MIWEVCFFRQGELGINTWHMTHKHTHTDIYIYTPIYVHVRTTWNNYVSEIEALGVGWPLLFNIFKYPSLGFPKKRLQEHPHVRAQRRGPAYRNVCVLFLVSMCFQSIFLYIPYYYSLVYVWTHFDTHGNQPKRRGPWFFNYKEGEPFMEGFNDQLLLR